MLQIVKNIANINFPQKKSFCLNLVTSPATLRSQVLDKNENGITHFENIIFQYFFLSLAN